MGYERPLGDMVSVERFMEKCLPSGLQYTDRDGNVLTVEQIFGKIEDAELLAQKAGCTQREEARRVPQYRSDFDREKLHTQIIQELIELPRIENDENIKLGEGGAKPQSDPKFDKQAYLIIGLPASGKSGIASRICDAYGAYLIDPDFAKRKLPEFDKSIGGASRVHRESMQVSLGASNPELPNLLAACLEMGVNIVRPLIGNDQKKLEVFAKLLVDRGYAVHLCLVDLDRMHATGRALRRFLQTGRYVSLPHIFDDCANDASLVYYRLRASPSVGTPQCLWSTFGAVSTFAQPPVKIDMVGTGNPAALFQEVV